MREKEEICHFYMKKKNEKAKEQYDLKEMTTSSSSSGSNENR